MNVIDVVDTTVRDGEQTSGVSFKPEEKTDYCQTSAGGSRRYPL